MFQVAVKAAISCELHITPFLLLAGKSILEFYKEPYSYDHVTSAPLIQLAAKHPAIVAELSKLALSSGKWCDTVRELSRYGGQSAKISAPKIFDRKSYAEDAVKDADEACSFLRRIETSTKMTRPIKVGLLSGQVTGEEEIPCSDYVFTGEEYDWLGRLSQIEENGKPRFQVESLNAGKIDNTYALIINPFGEVYPESDIKKRPVFEAIKEYVLNGGVFVNVAGFAFYYAWNVKTGGPKESIFLDRFLVPSALIRKEGDPKEIKLLLQEVLPFAGSLLWSQFGCVTTVDSSTVRGPQSLRITQTQEDIAIAGDIVRVGGSDIVREFRCVTSKTRDLIPFCRASHPSFGEVYPFAAIPHGQGYLVVAGIEMDNFGFEKILAVLGNFCSWLKRDARVD